MTTTFFCIETGNSLYGGTVRHFFNSPAAVMSFLKATREKKTESDDKRRQPRAAPKVEVEEYRP